MIRLFKLHYTLSTHVIADNVLININQYKWMKNYALRSKMFTQKKYKNKIKDIFPRNEITLGKRDKYVLYLKGFTFYTFISIRLA